MAWRQKDICSASASAGLFGSGGLILFPVVALFGDVLTEVYGYAESRKVIWTGLTSLILLVMMVWICGALPADTLWHNQTAYMAILGAVPRVAAASMTAYFVGEFANSYVLAKYTKEFVVDVQPIRTVAQ